LGASVTLREMMMTGENLTLELVKASLLVTHIKGNIIDATIKDKNNCRSGNVKVDETRYKKVKSQMYG
jgi:hypothetical protein